AQFTTAPAGSNSHEVFATGTSTEGCPPSKANAPCQVLYHSPDGGVTWVHLKAAGFTGGTVLLAPNFPVDNRIFVSGPSGLQISRDGGATFATAVPLAG